MLSVTHLVPVLQTVLTEDADDAARRTGFLQRRRKLTGSLFVRTLVFGWLHDPSASVEALTQTCADLGVDISPSAFHERFTPQAADCLAAVLIVKEAGGYVSDFLAGEGLAKGNPIIACAPGIKDALVSAVEIEGIVL